MPTTKSGADKKSKCLKNQNPELWLAILDFFSLKLETLETKSQNKGQNKNIYEQTQENSAIFCKVCNKSCFVADTKQKSLKIKQRLLDHLATKSHKVKLIKFLNKHTLKPLRTQIEIAANKQGLSFKTQQEKQLIRKLRIETMSKEVHFLKYRESKSPPGPTTNT